MRKLAETDLDNDAFVWLALTLFGVGVTITCEESGIKGFADEGALFCFEIRYGVGGWRGYWTILRWRWLS